MELTMVIISFITMAATIISCIIAVRAKNEAKRILTIVENHNYGTQNLQDNRVENKDDVKVSNTGRNDGVISGTITGGVNNNNVEKQRE